MALLGGSRGVGFMATNQKLTKKQKADRVRAAEERERRENERREAAERT